MSRTEENPHLFKVPRVETVFGRVDFVVERCRGKRVLHLGCVDEGVAEQKMERGEFLHFRLAEVASEIWGVDISAQGIELLRSRGGENLIAADLEELDTIEELKGREWDVIVLTEVIEHLNNPGLVLRAARRLFTESTRMIVSVPNGLRLTGLRYSLRGFEYVHPDHNYWFSHKTLETLMRKSGYRIEELAAYSFVDLGLDRPPGRERPGLFTRLRQWPSARARRWLRGRNPFLAADGILAVVQPDSS